MTSAPLTGDDKLITEIKWCSVFLGIFLQQTRLSSWLTVSLTIKSSHPKVFSCVCVKFYWSPLRITTRSPEMRIVKAQRFIFMQALHFKMCKRGVDKHLYITVHHSALSFKVKLKYCYKVNIWNTWSAKQSRILTLLWLKMLKINYELINHQLQCITINKLLNYSILP